MNKEIVKKLLKREPELVDMFDAIEVMREKLIINPKDIFNECGKQAVDFAEVAKFTSLATSFKDEAKADEDALLNRRVFEICEKLDKQKQKRPAASIIESEAKQDSEYKYMKEKHLVCRHMAKDWDGLREAYTIKVAMLKKMVDLVLDGFTSDKIIRDCENTTKVVQAAQADSGRRELGKKREARRR